MNLVIFLGTLTTCVMIR